MMYRYGRTNAMMGQPIALRCVTRTPMGELTDPSGLFFWRIHTVSDTDPTFDPDKHTLYTAPPDRIQRIRTGVYQAIIPAGICQKPDPYYDVVSIVPQGQRLSCKKADSLCYRNSFSLHKHALPLAGYASIDRVRRQDPQLTDEHTFPDDFVNDAIANASSLVDRWTGRWFVVRPQTLLLDGSGTRELPLPQPLLHLERLCPFFDANWPFSQLLDGRDPDPSDMEIQPVASEWDNPSLVAHFFPRGRRNILVQGLFGTVDEEGETPVAIAQAVARLAARDLLRCSSLGTAAAAGPVVSEHTDGHSYQLAVSAAIKEACFSGDPDIDAVVAAHKRPLVMGIGI